MFAFSYNIKVLLRTLKWISWRRLFKLHGQDFLHVFWNLSNTQPYLTIVIKQTDVALQRCCEEKMFWKYAINLQENFGVALQLYWITLGHGCSSVNLLHIFRTLFPKNTSGGLLLNKEILDTFRSWLTELFLLGNTAQKMKFSIKDFFIFCPVHKNLTAYLKT